MNAAVASAGTLAWVLLFVTGCAGFIFEADQLYDTFANLTLRECLLPGDFNASASVEPFSSQCVPWATEQEQPLSNQCQDVPVLALFYRCYAERHGLLGEGPAPPNGDALEEAIAAIYEGTKEDQSLMTSDDGWFSLANKTLDDCAARDAADLSLYQEAVYAYLCLRWSYFSKCDAEKDDAIAARRGVDFICDQDCPLSPERPEMLAAIELLGGITLAECSVGKYSGPDVLQLYQAKVDTMICLLDRFQTGNKLDYAALKAAIVAELTGAHSEAAGLLLGMVDACEDSKKTEDFVNCWKDIGLLDCVYEQANEVAAEFPNNCKPPKAKNQ